MWRSTTRGRRRTVSDREYDPSVSPFEYIKNFAWEQIKYHQGRTLVEITGKINENMKSIDNDVKRVQDELTEARNNLASLVKKEGSNFLTQDISEAIYTKPKFEPQSYFVEMCGSEAFTTLVAIVHKTKVNAFLGTYELIIKWNENGVFGAVPKSARPLEIEDKDGNQLWTITVFTSQLNDYLKKGKDAGLYLRTFKYDYEAYKKELQLKTEYENKVNLLKSTLATKAMFGFSELLIALMHLKVMRAFIDGVLRFGIPPRFYIGLVQPVKGQEKAVL